MLKRIAYRKIGVTVCALFTLICFYFFPLHEQTLETEKNIIYEDDENYEYIYLIDKFSYVSSLKMAFDEELIEDKLLKRIEYLIINGKYTNDLPKGFKEIIPANTKVNSIKINDDKIEIDFSKEIYNIKKEDASKMIESIIYTLTEYEIKNIYIYVDGEIMNKVQDIQLTYPLTRDYGINKKYDLEKLEDLNKTTIFYVSNNFDLTYYVPVTYVNNDKTEKIMIIIDELKSGSFYQSNLSSYLSNKTELEKYEIVDNKIYLDFNDKIFDTIDNIILEEVKYTISESIFDNYEVKEVVFRVDGEEIFKVS